MTNPRFPHPLVVAPFSVLLASMTTLVLGLSGCRLECLGDGPTTFDSLKLQAQSVQTLAGGAPIEIRADGQVHCVGQADDFQWSLEPALGEIQPTSNPRVVSYRPPVTIGTATDVKIAVRFHGYAQNNTATVSVRVLKP